MRSPPTPGPEGPDPAAGALVLGLDEAGRGSVLGPLVVGGFLAPAGSDDRLLRLGVRDSKQLSPARREVVLGRLAEVGRCFTRPLHPATIDASVLRHGLNDLEARGFAEILRRAAPDRVCLDACDVDPRRFGARVARFAGFSGEVVSRHHADRDLPVVAAASIVAKVRRDRMLAAIERRRGEPIGSGYPSDPRTIAYLRALPRGSPLPREVRRSWATTARVIREQATIPLERFDR